MEISVRLSDLSQEELKFIRQIGVERVDVHNPDLVPGYQGLGDDYLKAVPRVLIRIKVAGLKVASFRFPKIREALLGRPEGHRQIEVLCDLIPVLGSNDVPVLQMDTHSPRLSPGGVPGRIEKTQPRGYKMDAFQLARMREELAKGDLDSNYAHHFTNALTPEAYHERLVYIYEKIVPFLEDAEVRLAIHTDDPPVPDSEGLLPGLTTPEQIMGLLDAVPSKNTGVLFCTGTRYESGVNIYDQIDLFGPRIFHVHFRNVRGTLPRDGGYDEVMLDEGDMDMLEVVRALDRVGYEGSLNTDHDAVLEGDTPYRNAARAFSVGYIRALLSAL
jgi:mannonate dehydratase